MKCRAERQRSIGVGRGRQRVVHHVGDEAGHGQQCFGNRTGVTVLVRRFGRVIVHLIPVIFGQRHGNFVRCVAGDTCGNPLNFAVIDGRYTAVFVDLQQRGKISSCDMPTRRIAPASRTSVAFR